MANMMCRSYLTPLILALVVLPMEPSSIDIEQSESPSIENFAIPTYEIIARQANAQGAVTVRVVIGRSGEIQGLHAEAGNELLLQSVRNAVKKWKFEKCEHCARELTITFEFRLEGEPTDAYAPCVVSGSFPNYVSISTRPPFPHGH